MANLGLFLCKLFCKSAFVCDVSLCEARTGGGGGRCLFCIGVLSRTAGSDV